MRVFSNQSGFTLIEIIIVMIILGILTVGGVFGLNEVTNGYQRTQANAASTQKAQNALDRMVIELSHITYSSSGARYNVTAGSGSSLTYTANFGGSDETHTIDQSGNLARFDTDNTKILTDGVVTNGLQFSYFDGNGNAVAATSTDMRLIGVSLTVQVISGVTRTYSARVALQQ
jgi:prepilin-type N-terminal cleavage/methylation domain-containing protein